MKNFKANPVAVEQLQALSLQALNICKENGIPFVMGFCVETTEDAAGTAVTAYVDGSKTPTPNTIIGAIEMLKSSDVPDELIGVLKLRNMMGGECDCENCRKRRAEAAN